MSRDAPEQRDDHAQQYRAITAYVTKHQPCSFAGLFEIFCEHPGTHEQRKGLHKRLQTLLDRGVLSKVVVNRAAVWSLQTKKLNDAQAAPGAQAVATPARQFSFLSGPVYRPPPTAAQRPGADAFLQVRSHGVRC